MHYDIDDKKLGTNSDLSDHMLVYTELKRYSCNIYYQNFTRLSSPKVDMGLHNRGMFYHMAMLLFSA